MKRLVVVLGFVCLMLSACWFNWVPPVMAGEIKIREFKDLDKGVRTIEVVTVSEKTEVIIIGRVWGVEPKPQTLEDGSLYLSLKRGDKYKLSSDLFSCDGVVAWFEFRNGVFAASENYGLLEGESPPSIPKLPAQASAGGSVTEQKPELKPVEPVEQQPAPGPTTSIIQVANVQYASSYAWATLDKLGARELLLPEFTKSDFRSYSLPITRVKFAEQAVLLYEANNETIRGRRSFTDVNNVSVEKLASLGVVLGDEGKFYPDRLITRQEAATIIKRLFEAKTGGIPMPVLIQPLPIFTDEVAPWAADSVKDVSGAGIMRGYGDGTFGAERLYSHEECVVSLDRTMELAADTIGAQVNSD